MATDTEIATALFCPSAIALVGASGDASKNTARPQRFLQQHGYTGRIVPINRHRDEVLGLRAWPTLADAPGPIEHAFVICGGNTVKHDDLPSHVCDRSSGHTAANPLAAAPHQRPLENAEAAAIRDALARHGGNRSRAAQDLSISRNTLWRKMKRHGLL